jgi:hypothetical protein
MVVSGVFQAAEAIVRHDQEGAIAVIECSRNALDWLFGDEGNFLTVDRLTAEQSAGPHVQRFAGSGKYSTTDESVGSHCCRWPLQAKRLQRGGNARTAAEAVNMVRVQRQESVIPSLL